MGPSQPSDLQVIYDRFGNALDPAVGYARGRILATPVDDIKRRFHAWTLTQSLIETQGTDQLAILTGAPGHVPSLSQTQAFGTEWIGPGSVAGKLKDLALGYLGGAPHHRLTLYSRGQAAILAWFMLYGRNRPVLSIVPFHGRGNPSVHFAAAAAGSVIIEAVPEQVSQELLQIHRPSCALITRTNRAMEEISTDRIALTARTLRRANCNTLLDEGPGWYAKARRHKRKTGLQNGVDAVVVNADKLSPASPPCALVGGDADIIYEMSAWAAAAGTDTTGSTTAAVLNALVQSASSGPHSTKKDATAAEFCNVMATQLGASYVTPRPDGLVVTEEDALDLVLARREGSNPHQITPAEVTTAVALYALHRGIITVNSHGHPGTSPSIYLRPTAGSLDAAGGMKALAETFDDAFSWAVANLHRPDAFRSMILGHSHIPTRPRLS
jgi:L-seryl-tRNA(Ser) seleniumtransferase